MATRIRLQRKGRKGKPIYSLVIADQRSPRDGKFIEKVGTYNPNTNPATINTVSYTQLRAHETTPYLLFRLLLEK